MRVRSFHLINHAMHVNNRAYIVCYWCDFTQKKILIFFTSIIGRQIALENPDIEQEMIQAVEEVHQSGEAMSSTAREFATDPCSSAKRGNMVRALFIYFLFQPRLWGYFLRENPCPKTMYLQWWGRFFGREKSQKVCNELPSPPSIVYRGVTNQ